CHNVVCLRPCDSAQQVCTCYELVVLPEPGVYSHYVDFFGNAVTFFAVQEPHRTLTVTAKSTVEVTPRAVPQPDRTPGGETVRDTLHRELSTAAREAVQSLFAPPHIPCSSRLRHYAAPSFPPGQPLLAAVLDLTRRIYTDFVYDPQATSVSTPLHDVLRA